MAGRGRPFAADPRDIQYRLRLSKKESDILNRVSKACGMSKSDTLRKLIEDYEKEHLS